MDRRKALLAVAVVLFVGWMAYLIQLALTHRHSTVISRPQILVSQVVVVAHIEGDHSPNEEATIEQVLFPEKEVEGVKGGEILRIANLPQSTKNWTGAGDYLLPLEKVADGFLVTSIPRSPGFLPAGSNSQPLIYRWTHEIEEQFKHVPKPAFGK
ncbi:MAG TPA: hypothetical protein VGG61_16505 [Gemmataceae bacterium]